MKKKIYKTFSEKETNNLAKKIAKDLETYRVICLYGELGAGKTVFSKSFARALGVKSRVISPTFVLIRKHKIGARKNLYHIDAFRLSDSDRKDLEAINEILRENNAIIIIEWAEKIREVLPEKRIDIEFELLDKNDAREITVIKH